LLKLRRKQPEAALSDAPGDMDSRLDFPLHAALLKPLLKGLLRSLAACSLGPLMQQFLDQR